MSRAEPIVYSSKEEQSIYVDTGGNPTWIVNGERSAECGWPSTVAVPGCTGTLIHPRVIISAAHCSPSAGWTVKFGESSGNPEFSVTAEKCNAGPGAGSSTGKGDWAYCILPDDERLKQVQFTPPLFGCEWDKYLKEGMKVWTVGFGDTGSGSGDYGTKREVEVPLNEIGDGYVDIGLADGTGNCHGDSGGPVFVHLVDGANDWGWRVFGMTHGPGSGGCDCTCTTVFASTMDVVPIIEEEEGIDVTPCMAADGTWTGGPECTGMPLNPGQGGGSYPACNGLKTGPLDSCGQGTGGLGGMGGGGAGGGGAGGGGAGGGAGTAGTSGGGGIGGAAGNGGTAGGGAGAGGAAGSAGQGGGAGGGGAGGSAGTAGAAGLGGAGGSASGGAGGTGVGTGGAPPVDGGCACTTVGAPPTSLGLTALAAAALLGAGARRKRRAR